LNKTNQVTLKKIKVTWFFAKWIIKQLIDYIMKTLGRNLLNKY